MRPLRPFIKDVRAKGEGCPKSRQRLRDFSTIDLVKMRTRGVKYPENFADVLYAWILSWATSSLNQFARRNLTPALKSRQRERPLIEPRRTVTAVRQGKRQKHHRTKAAPRCREMTVLRSNSIFRVASAAALHFEE